jgi:hypothetical protein
MSRQMSNASGEIINVELTDVTTTGKPKPQEYLSFLSSLGYLYNDAFVNSLRDLDGSSICWTVRGTVKSQPNLTAASHFQLSLGSEQRNQNAIAKRLGYWSAWTVALQNCLRSPALPPDALFFLRLFNERACPLGTQFGLSKMARTAHQLCYWLEGGRFAVVDSEWYACSFYDSPQKLVNAIVSCDHSYDDMTVLDTESTNALKFEVGISHWY